MTSSNFLIKTTNDGTVLKVFFHVFYSPIILSSDVINIEHKAYIQVPNSNR